MKKSKAIALSLLGLGTGGLAVGCGAGSDQRVEPSQPQPVPAPLQPAEMPREPSEIAFEPDDTWFDKEGNALVKEWIEEPNGKKKPVQHPHDRLGRPWVYDEEGNLVPPEATTVQPRPVIGGIMFLYLGGGVGGRPGSVAAPPKGGLNTLRPGMPGVSKGGLGTTGGRVTPIGG